MSGKKYVPEGVYLVCDKGSKPSEFKIIYYAETSVYGEHMATEADKIFVANFEPFGACSCNQGKPCVAQVTSWENVTDGITLNGNSLLLEDSELPCALGGTIKIYFSLQAAMVAVPEPEEEERSFWDKTLDFGAGVGEGLWKGAKGTVTGVYDLAVWSGKHSVPYMLLNPEGYKEQLQQDKETFQALGGAAKSAGTWVYRNSTVNYILDRDDFMAAQVENAEAFDALQEKMANMDAREWGDLTGQVLFEVGTTVATAGTGAAATAVKAADKTVDVARAVNTMDNLADGARALEKADDVVDGARALENSRLPVPEELGPVVNKTDDIPAHKMKGRRPATPEYPVKNPDGTLTEYGKWYYDRPSGYRSGVRDDTWNAAKNSDGDVFDPLKKDQKINPDDPWDMGHKPGYEFRKHQQSAADRGISREQFLDEHNNYEHYRPELPSSNRSHADEIMDDTYFGK